MKRAVAWRDERRSSFLCQAKLGDPRKARLGPGGPGRLSQRPELSLVYTRDLSHQ